MPIRRRNYCADVLIIIKVGKLRGILLGCLKDSGMYREKFMRNVVIIRRKVRGAILLLQYGAVRAASVNLNPLINQSFPFLKVNFLVTIVKARSGVLRTGNSRTAFSSMGQP